jgi:tetratricopeptide (TPR) repeat protein
MNLHAPSSLQAILKRRQQEEFIGRNEQLNLFRQNMVLPLNDDRRRFVFSVWGQGGVGKTWLIRRFFQLAKSSNALTSWIDEKEEDIASVMGRIAEQCEQQGHPFRTFSARYRIYRQRRQELEADPEAPQGFSGFVGRTIAKTGMRLARGIPVGGMILDLVDEEALAKQASEWATYVARKLTNKDEVQLVREPVKVLTPLFLEDLQHIGERYALALFFDTYERTSVYLDSWLRDLLEGRYGLVPGNIVLVIAGQHELDRNAWGPYEGLLARLPLEPFTFEEACEYLTRKRITAPDVVGVILNLSGRLPLLIATLATESPQNPAQVGEPSGTAVERFLKWVEDPLQRRVGLDAALPRYLNQDIVTMLVGEEHAHSLFAWLKGVPFVTEGKKGWAYHRVVRSQMLRHKYRESPQSWAVIHEKLGHYYDGLQNALELTETVGRRDTTWQDYALEALYHRLCQAPRPHLPTALNGFLAALQVLRVFARRWADMLLQAGEDAGAAEVQHWGVRLRVGLQAYEEDRYAEATAMFTALLESNTLEVQWRPVALNWRGYLYYLDDQYPQALADLTAAIQMAPEEAEYWVDRGRTYHETEQYEHAIADFNRAIELAPHEAEFYTQRGETLRLMGHYEEALEDFGRAIAFNSEDAAAFVNRGLVRWSQGCFEEVLPDFDRAIALESEYAWAYAMRGVYHQVSGNDEQALANFTRAIDLDPTYAWATVNRGLTYRRLERYEEALADLDRTLALEPRNAIKAMALAYRGETHRLMGNYETSLTDLSQAIELENGNTEAIVSRGLSYYELERYEEALADLSQAINLTPDDADTLHSRGLIYYQLERYEEALVDFTQAIHLEPDLLCAFANRASVYEDLGRLEEALGDCNRVIELGTVDPPGGVYAIRGKIYHLMGRYQEAVEDLTYAMELGLTDAWLFSVRGQAYRALGYYEEAVGDFSRAIEQEPDEEYYHYNRALTYQVMEQASAAQADLNAAMQHAQQACGDDTQNWHSFFNLAICYITVGKDEAAGQLYHDALSRGASPDSIRGAIYDLQDFLVLFPNNSQARGMRDLLTTFLEESPK